MKSATLKGDLVAVICCVSAVKDNAVAFRAAFARGKHAVNQPVIKSLKRRGWPNFPLVALVGNAVAAVEFENPLGRVVQEVAIVGDGDHGAGEALQEHFQPLDRLGVQVIGRLVEQDEPRAHREHAREREAQAEARATLMVSEAVGKGDVQALNYFIAQKYTEALKEMALSPNSKTIYMPLEASSVIGAIGGIAQLAKNAGVAAPKG